MGVDLGERGFVYTEVDISLPVNGDISDSVEKILAKLSVYSIIPEYSI